MENSNIEKIKKYFYSGVGFASHSSEIIKNAVDEIVSQGKLSEKDGQKIVKDAIGKIEDRYNEAAQKLGKYAIDEISMLRKQVEGLEKKLAAKSPAAAKAVNAVKKAASSQPIVKKAISKANSIVKKAAAKPAAKKATAKKAAVKKPAAKKAPVKKAAAKKAPAKKAA